MAMDSLLFHQKRIPVMETTEAMLRKDPHDWESLYRRGVAAANLDRPLSDDLLRRAMAHATVLASFNVEQFGTDRVRELTREEIDARLDELHAMTQFAG